MLKRLLIVNLVSSVVGCPQIIVGLGEKKAAQKALYIDRLLFVLFFKIFFFFINSL